MLSRSTQISRNTSLPALESVHSLQEHLPHVQSDSGKDFPDIGEEKDENNGEQDKSSEISAQKQRDSASDFTALMPTKDFGELLQQFFVDDHKRLFVLRSKLILGNEGKPNTLFSTSNANAPKMHALRKQLYNLQLVIYRHPKGRQYDIAQ